MDGKSRSYMRAVCAVLAAGLLTAGCGKEETAAAETAEIAVPEAAKRAEGSETTASAEFFSEFKNTIYESVFTGRLGSPVRLDENSYQVDILEMEYENPL